MSIGEFNELKEAKSYPSLSFAKVRAAIPAVVAALLFIRQWPIQAGDGDTQWMRQGKYGIFLHYQYRILLGYSIKTKPQFPNPAQMNAEQWNRFVDGFDVKGFADQMAEVKAGWVLFCLDDHSIVHNANPKAVIAFSYGGNEQACVCTGVDDYTGGDTWSKQDLKRLTPTRLPLQGDILWHGKIYCGNVYHGMGDANQFPDQELIDWIKACNQQGGVCTLDWPFNPNTGLLKDFGFAQLKRIANALKGD